MIMRIQTGFEISIEATWSDIWPADSPAFNFPLEGSAKIYSEDEAVEFVKEYFRRFNALREACDE